MYLATPAEPTKETASTSGEVSRASTASFAPWTTLNTPSGRPASISSSAILMADNGVRCDGLRTNVFPHTSAMGIIHSGTMLGKLKGVFAHPGKGLRAAPMASSSSLGDEYGNRAMVSPVAGSGIGSTWTPFDESSRNSPPMKFGTVATLMVAPRSRHLEAAAREEPP